MPSTEAALCNLALLRIGQRETIQALSDNTTSGEACELVYADARDAVLESFDWPFAKRRADLATLNLTRSGWDFVYALPADCIAPRSIYNGSDPNPPAEQRIPFAREDDATNGGIILTDQQDAELLYTARFTVVTRFPPLFVQALTWKLAAELAYTLPVKPALAEAMEKKYQVALATAEAAALNQQREVQEPDSEFFRIR